MFGIRLENIYASIRYELGNKGETTEKLSEVTNMLLLNVCFKFVKLDRGRTFN